MCLMYVCYGESLCRPAIARRSFLWAWGFWTAVMTSLKSQRPHVTIGWSTRTQLRQRRAPALSAATQDTETAGPSVDSATADDTPTDQFEEALLAIDAMREENANTKKTSTVCRCFDQQPDRMDADGKSCRTSEQTGRPVN